MHVRMTTLHGDASKQQKAVDVVENKARAAVEAAAGNRGFATMTGPGGTLIGASFWESAEAAAASQESLSELREEMADLAGGTATVETYEVAVARRLSMPPMGALVRMLRIEIDPAAVDAGIAEYRDQVLPRLVDAPGLCSALLLVDRAAGRAVGFSTWEDEVAAEKAQHTLDQVRADVADSTGARFSPVENLTMVRSTAQLD